jgi:hypothetical protein
MPRRKFALPLERRLIRLNQPDRKTAAQMFEAGPVFDPMMFQLDQAKYRFSLPNKFGRKCN